MMYGLFLGGYSRQCDRPKVWHACFNKYFWGWVLLAN
jgi:hypothetical protein